MNGMNFKPFISKVLDSLSDEQIGDFAKLIDKHSGDFNNRSLLIGNITEADMGVGLYTIQLDENTIRTGYLIYTDTYCVLLSYLSNSERIAEYEIDVELMTYRTVKEYLTTDYLRHEVAIRANGVIDAGTVVVNNITSIDGDTLSSLKAGDIVLKNDSTGKHAYVVSFKKDGTGICLTYTDASVVETVSYDFTDNAWVYNSTDVTPLGGGTDITASDIDSESATQGQVLTADGSGGASWQDNPVGMSNPMTTAGDVIVGGSSGAPTRLAKGTDGQVLTMVSGDVAWANIAAGAIPTVTIALTQVVSQNPLTIQLTNEQYDIALNNGIIYIDNSALGFTTMPTIVKNSETSSYLNFVNYEFDDDDYGIYQINKSTKQIVFSQHYLGVIQYLTSSAATISYTNFSNLLVNHYYVINNPTMTGLDGSNDFVQIDFSVQFTSGGTYEDLGVTLINNYLGNYWTGLTSYDDGTHFYEIAVFYDGNKIVLRCATVY